MTLITVSDSVQLGQTSLQSRTFLKAVNNFLPPLAPCWAPCAKKADLLSHVPRLNLKA